MYVSDFPKKLKKYARVISLSTKELWIVCYRQAEFWEDPKKRSRLEALLEEMEAILAEESMLESKAKLVQQRANVWRSHHYQGRTTHCFTPINLWFA